MNSKTVALLVLLLASSLFIGCDGGGGGDDDPVPTVDVTGRWSGRTSAGNPINMNLTQTGAGVSGTATSGDQTGSTVGTVDGNTFSFSQVWNAFETTGSAAVDGNFMSGTLTENGTDFGFSANR